MYQKYVALRDARGVTDYAVAKACKIGTSTFSDWRNGRSNPKLPKLMKIANYFGVPVGDLIEDPEGGHEEKKE